jgi:hypothetical protein
MVWPWCKVIRFNIIASAAKKMRASLNRHAFRLKKPNENFFVSCLFLQKYLFS